MNEATGRARNKLEKQRIYQNGRTIHGITTEVGDHIMRYRR